MNRIAEFETVSYEQFCIAYKNAFPETEENQIRSSFLSVKKPKRATSYSAGYDFYSTKSFTLKPGETILVPTGIRAKIEPGWGLFIYPRSGLGFKFRLQLNNTVGIIDGDYYFADNEGHIMIKIINDSRENKVIQINEGDAFVQGVFMNYGITVDDDVDVKRTGGFGSTG